MSGERFPVEIVSPGAGAAMSVIQTLTPQMTFYNERFTDEGSVRWLPYFMFFNPPNYRSAPVNTDSKGFRYSNANGIRYSVAEHNGVDNARLLAGNSLVFGSGATGDQWTLSSRMSVDDPDRSFWLNFGGVAFNSTQELIMLVLYRHLLPKIEAIILVSGFNNLGLARQPAKLRGDQGTLFSGDQFYESMYARNESGWRSFVSRHFRTKRRVTYTSETPSMTDQVVTYHEVPTVGEQIEDAARLTLLHLDMWRAIAADMGAKLTFMLQPFAPWVRERGSAEERALFAELDAIGSFSESYGDILASDVGAEYASRLELGAKKMGVGFVDLNPLFADALRPDQWAYVDRIHLTNEGYGLLAKVISKSLR
jgi:hypothetical protein